MPTIRGRGDGRHCRHGRLRRLVGSGLTGKGFAGRPKGKSCHPVLFLFCRFRLRGLHRGNWRKLVHEMASKKKEEEEEEEKEEEEIKRRLNDDKNRQTRRLTPKNVD